MVNLTKEDRDPRGGLTASGRAKYNRATGGNLKPGVRGAANTPEKMRRKGSFLTRFYGRRDLPALKESDGDPTRFALAARAWGEAAPSTVEAARKLAEKGRRLLARYGDAKK